MRKYTEDHEWIELNGNIGTVGITDYAQHQLGDVVFVELPAVGKKVAQKGEAAVVESVKAASEIYAPVAGEVVEVNSAIADNPALINESAESSAWFLRLKVSNPAELDSLMDEARYKDYIKGL